MKPVAGLRAAATTWLMASIIGALLVIVLTNPMVPKLTTVGRLNNGDGKFSVWNVGWVSRALIEDPRHVLDANIFWPHTGTLAYSELNLVAGAFGAPVYAITHNALAATNAAIAIALWLSFLCTWALVRRLTGSSAAGMVAGTAYTFCPYLLSHTSHVQLLMAFVIPLDFLALHRLIERPNWWRGVQLGLAVAVSGLACGYYGIYGGIVLGIGALWFGSRSRAYWLGLGIALLTAGLVVAPVMVPFQRARASVAGGPRVNVESLETYSSQPIDYIVSGAQAHSVWQPPFPDRDPLFPGIIALLGTAVALWGAVRRRRMSVSSWTISGYAVVGLVSVWASFGPKAGLYAWLFRIVPAMDLLRAPSRFGLISTFACAVLAGIAISSVRRRTWVAAVLTILVAAESAALTAQWGWPSWPLQRMDPVPRAYTVLASLPRGAVVEFPFPYKSMDLLNHSRSMLLSTYHWQPMVNGYSDVIPSDMYDIMLPINGFPDADSFKIMQARQVKYVLWDLRTYNAESRAALMARFPAYAQHLKAIVHDDDVWLDEIVSYPQ